MCKYKLQKIAYCSDPDDKTFAFIVKKGDNVHQCYCFETQHSVSKLLALSVILIMMHETT